jgi:uncharacterized OB-fold protein
MSEQVGKSKSDDVPVCPLCGSPGEAEILEMKDSAERVIATVTTMYVCTNPKCPHHRAV